MCKIEKGQIEREINEKIRKNWENIEWAGVEKENICKLIRVEAILSSDFQYKGEENYPFGGTVEFYKIVKSDNNNAIPKQYQIMSSNRVHIKEGKDNVEIKINEPILVTPK